MFRVLGAVCAIICLSASFAWARAVPPASSFGRLPAIQTAVLSPDGKTVAILGGAPKRRLISLSPIDAETAVPVDLGAVDVRRILWAGNDHVIVQIATYETGRDPVNNRPFAYHYERNVVISAKGKVVTRLLNNSAYAEYALSIPVLRVIHGPRPVAYVLGLDSNGQHLVQALWEVDVLSGKGKIIERGLRSTRSWAVDASGTPRLRVDVADGGLLFYTRPKGAWTWRVIERKGAPASDVFLGYSERDDALLFERADASGAKVVSHGVADGVETVLGPADKAVSAGLTWDATGLHPVGIVTEADRVTYRWLDAEIGAVHGKLSRVFKGRPIQLYDWSRDRARYLFRVEASVDSGPQWMLFESRTNQVSPIGPEYPELEGRTFGEARWFTYKARDGLDINAYLTLPPGLAKDARPPLVILPHGGPAQRDSYGFDWWVQFLVSRGYAVLQPQFRGSSGFGEAFERAGDREWAGKMQTDLLDGVAHLARDGVVDPGQVCVVGASYGGYAALAAMTFHPEAYRCAVSVNGISDVGLMILDTSRAKGKNSASLAYWRKVAGDSRATPGFLESISPARQAARIQGPVLLIHGAEDTVVDIIQSRVMDKAMKAAGGDVQFIVLPGDDHYLSSSETRTRMLESVDAFLARHLPVAH